MRKPRHLSPEEQELWGKVADRTIPMHPSRPKKLVKTKSEAARPKPDKQTKTGFQVPAFEIGQKANPARPHDTLRPLADRLRTAPVNMDHKSFTRMQKGKLKPEARIDLHGMTVAEAHPELVAFILGSQAIGRRLVLVITGKGKERDEGGPIPTRLGILRHQVPQWLALPPLAQTILQVTPAHLKHGGHGAYYVYLRRNR